MYFSCQGWAFDDLMISGQVYGKPRSIAKCENDFNDGSDFAS